ncbi:hypothetical protein C6P45_000099 [Maudiozyma exigua]|uniref:Uncharacterized protein n=1 Tax=Maudiozyma exigua TaxID=34358 RepID=A0A9P7BDA2_MAUEX|nr:hypothetical protein C6P45_000099 [Kazachstania exigua]
MSSVLQLLVDYYKAVLESNRIYNESQQTYITENNKKDDDTRANSGNIAPKIANETLLLQRQLTDLTSQLQDLKRKNESLQEQQKSYKALSESKIVKFKKTIESLKRRQRSANNNKKKKMVNGEERSSEDEYVTEENESDKKKFDYHLLSPVAKRGLKRGLKISNGSGNNTNNSNNNGSRKGTIFDSKKETFSEDDDSTDDSIESPSKTIRRPRMEHEESFLKSFDNHSQSTNTNSESSSKKRKVKQLDNVDIPSLNDFSRDDDDDDDEEDYEANNADTPKKKPRKLNLRKSPVLKKRKLIRKKIEKFNENGDDSLNKDSMEKSV